MLTVESTTAERLIVDIVTTGDPTGTAPDFAVGTGPDPSGWEAGTWSGSWDSSSGRVAALSPLIGAGQDLDVTGGTDYKLWVRWAVGAETPVKAAGVVRVT